MVSQYLYEFFLLKKRDAYPIFKRASCQCLIYQADMFEEDSKPESHYNTISLDAFAPHDMPYGHPKPEVPYL